jgi:hypothetical protein
MMGMQDDDLDRLLAEAAGRPEPPSAALMERVLADALAHQPVMRATPAAGLQPRPGVFARLVAAIGGIPALAGLGTAAIFGLALGYLNPTTLDYLTGTTDETAEFFPQADFLTTEG